MTFLSYKTLTLSLTGICSLALINCGGSNHESKTSFWDLPELIEEWQTDGYPDDTSVMGNNHCPDIMDHTMDSDQQCHSQQEAKSSFIHACDGNHTDNEADTNDLGDVAQKVERGADYSNTSACYEAEAGFKRVIEGSVRAELATTNNSDTKRIDSELTIESELFTKQIDIFNLIMEANARQLESEASIFAFGKEIWSRNAQTPKINISYMADDNLRNYKITYGIPIPMVPVSPKVTTGLKVTGDFFFSATPGILRDNEFNMLSRIASGAYLRPYAEAELDVFGFELMKATVAGFAQIVSDDMIHEGALRKDGSTALVAKPHQSVLSQGNLYVMASILRSKFYHFFFGKDQSTSNNQNDCTSPKPACPCEGIISELSQAEGSWDLYNRDLDEDDEGNEINNPNTSSLICDPMSKTWMLVSKPVWEKQWQESEIDTKKVNSGE